jgi:hypothetical protein
VILPAGMTYADDAQHPVSWAIRELNGPRPATPQPNGDDERLEGDAPCPVKESGDHLQVAITKTDTGSMQYIIPFVGLFGEKAKPVLRSTFAVSSHRARARPRSSSARPLRRPGE